MRATMLLVVLGPTAVGKSEIAVRLAEALDGEVISADSMQVYKGFDIGTGKLTREEMRSVPHHLIDVVEPKEHYSAARFVQEADSVIHTLSRRQKGIVVAGGTGLYLKALLYGLFQAPEADPEIRDRHRQICEQEGVEALFKKLEIVDAEAAARISATDQVRISRALEIFEQTGQPISELHRAHGFSEQRYGFLQIGIRSNRTLLRERIECRVDRMIAAGWLDEVRSLRDAGYELSHPMGALGYRHLSLHLKGELDFNEAVRQTKRDTWRFAKRQLNWFCSLSDVWWFEEVKEADLQQILEEYDAVRQGARVGSHAGF